MRLVKGEEHKIKDAKKLKTQKPTKPLQWRTLQMTKNRKRQLLKCSSSNMDTCTHTHALPEYGVRESYERQVSNFHGVSMTQ